MPAQKITECCMNCSFSRTILAAKQFILMECRFDAPTLPNAVTGNQWPPTCPEKWCGKYKFDSQATNGFITYSSGQEESNAENTV